MLAPALALLLALAPGDAAAAPRPLLVFQGNVILTDEVYQNLLDLPADARATPALADEVEARVLRFLRRSGYDLATAVASVRGDQIVIDVDEGRVDRIIYLGESAVGTLFFRLETLLPFNIFNRPLLQRQLGLLKDQFNLKAAKWQLVSVGKKEDPIPIEALQTFRDQTLRKLREGDLAVRPTGFELRITVEHYDRGGISPVLGIGSGNGVEVGANYRRPSALLRDDALEGELRIGGNTRQRIDTGQRGLFLSHLSGLGRWFTPRLFGTRRVRAYVEGGADLISRQRTDLDLNSFRFLTVQGSLNVNAILAHDLTVSAGSGFERRWLYALEPATATTPLLPVVAGTAAAQTRIFGTLSLHALLPPDELRADRKHRLDALGVLYGLPETLEGKQESLQGRLEIEYQRVFYFGYHELWVQGRGYFLFGQVSFPDDYQVSDVTRGPFSSLFVRKVAGPRLEFRFALLRDILQFGVYDDAALYRPLDRAGVEGAPQLADAVGVAVHALLLDTFQVDLNLGTGFNTQGRIDTGLSLRLVQAF